MFIYYRFNKLQLMISPLSATVRKLQQLILISIALILLATLSSCNENPAPDNKLPRSTPEAENIDPQSIVDFLNAVDESGLELHSFMVVRNGKVAAEGWWDPYKADLKHTMYSTSKAFTSTAIGFAVTEGLLTVEDKVISFFPESLPDTVSENLASMCVKDLLTMSAGQDPEPTFSRLLPSDDWVKAFLETPVPNKPGSTFLYNSSATYMLSAILTELTGETVLDYLTPRLFEPLNITGMDWEVDPDGINVGGWGLRIKTEDMAKFGQLFLQKGKWNGKQVIPESWVEEASSAQIIQNPDLPEAEKAKSDWEQGYGYKFWRSRHNSYRADGAYGQGILILPEKNAVVVLTAEAHDMQKEFNLVWDHLLPGMKDEAIEIDESIDRHLSARIDELKLSPPKSDSNPDKETEISDATYLFEGENAKKEISFIFDKNGSCITIFKTDQIEEAIHFGEGKWVIGETSMPVPNLLPQPDDNMEDLLPFIVAGAYRWIEANTLELNLRYIESPHTEYYTFIFEENVVTLKEGNSRNRNRNPLITKGNKI